MSCSSADKGSFFQLGQNDSNGLSACQSLDVRWKVIQMEHDEAPRIRSKWVGCFCFASYKFGSRLVFLLAHRNMFLPAILIDLRPFRTK